MAVYPYSSVTYNTVTGGVSDQSGSIETPVIEGVQYDTGRVVVKSDKTPGFAEAIEQGKLLGHTEHHVYREKLEINFSQMSGKVGISTFDPDCEKFWVENSGYHAVRISVEVPIKGIPPAIDHNPLLIEAVANAQTAAFDLATTIAELPETLSFFKGGVEAVRNRLLAIKPKALKAAVKRWMRIVAHEGARPAARSLMSQALAISSDEVSKAWLSYRYGLMPVVYSSQDLLAAYKRLDGNDRTIDIVEGRAGTSASSTDGPALPGIWHFDGTPPGHGGAGFVAQNDCQVHRKVRASAQCRLSRTFSTLQISPITFWEVVPLSFVVDWFTNIADHILAYFPPPGAQTVCSWSEKDVYRSTHIHRWNPQKCGLSYSDLTCVLERDEYHRYPAELPSLDISNLTFSGAERLNLSRLADAAALIRQLGPDIVREIANALVRMVPRR